MPKALKYSLFALAAAVALLVVGAAIVAATFDPNDYKPLIVDRVKQDRQRTLAIPGAIKLSFFPSLGVQLGELSLSEHGRAELFASVRSARISLAVLPLLHKQIVVDKIVIDGLRATLVRRKDGSTNIDDLTGTRDKAAGAAPAPSATAPQALGFDVAGVVISDASITIDDQLNGRHVALTKADIKTGRIAPGVAGDVSFAGHVTSDAPQLDADVGLKGNLLLDPEHRRYALKSLAADVAGRVATLSGLKARLGGNADVALDPLRVDLADLELSLQGKPAQGSLEASLRVPQLKLGEKDIAAQKIAVKLVLKQGSRTVQAQIALPSFAGSAQAFTIPALDGDVSIDDGALQAHGKIAGAMAGDTAKMLFSSTQTTLTLDGKEGATAIKGTLATPWSVNLKTQAIELPRLAANATLPNPKGGSLALKATGSASARLDRHTLDATLSGKLDQSAFSARFGMASFAPAAYTFDVSIDQIDVDRYRSAGSAANSQGRAASPDTPIDLSALRELRATGSLKVGALKAANMKASNLRVDLRAAGGKLELGALNAELYQGRASGSATLEASTPPRLAVKQALTNVNVGPLLQDALGRNTLDGHGNVTLDVTAQGATVGAMMKALAGTARLELRDGMLHGVNIAQAIRNGKAKLGLGSGAQGGTGSQSEGTDFSELGGSFVIAHGVAHNDDLLVASPLLRITGNGDVDLAESRLDYTVKATVVPTLQGQGGPELQALRGQTIPVHLKGPFTAIGYSIDYATVLKDLVKGQSKEQLVDKLKQLLGK